MRTRNIGNQWHKTFVRILKNPTFEVLAAIVVVLLATWVVVQTEIDMRPSHFGAVPFGQK
jgi:hypothetical protein